MKRIYLALFLILSFSELHAKRITVAGAANIQNALKDLANDFQKRNGDEVRVVVASSGELTAQIKQGAPYHLFLSADMKYPEALYKEGFGILAPKIYAAGVLILMTIFPELNLDLPFDRLFLQEKIKKIAIANPVQAPYGKEAVNALTANELEVKLKRKLVYAGSISQVNQFIFSGSADIGFTSYSTIFGKEMPAKIYWRKVTPTFYNRIDQGIILLKYSSESEPELSRKFYDYIGSAQAKEILKKNGYGIN